MVITVTAKAIPTYTVTLEVTEEEAVALYELGNWSAKVADSVCDGQVQLDRRYGKGSVSRNTFRDTIGAFYGAFVEHVKA